MSFLDEVIGAVGASGKMSAEVKGIVTDFLGANRGFFEGLGAGKVETFFQSLYQDGSLASWANMVEAMGEDELLALLRETGLEAGSADEARAAAVEQWRTFANAVGVAAVRVLVPVIVGAL